MILKKYFLILLCGFLMFFYTLSSIGHATTSLDANIRGVLKVDTEEHTFTGLKYEHSFDLPEDADESFALYHGHVINVIAGGFDLEYNLMWILRFYDPMLGKKVQLYPGLPGEASKKEVVDITDSIEKYGFMYVSKLELDTSKIYLFNFGKTIALDAHIQDDAPLYKGQLPDKFARVTSVTQQLAEQENAFEMQSQLTNLSDILTALNQNIVDIQTQAQIQAIEFIRNQVASQTGQIIDSGQVAIIETQKVKVNTPNGLQREIIVVTVEINGETLLAQAEYDEETGEIHDIKKLDSSDDLVGALKARNALANNLEIDNTEDIIVDKVIPLVNHMQEKRKQADPTQAKIITKEFVLKVKEETYVVQATFIEPPAAFTTEDRPEPSMYAFAPSVQARPPSMTVLQNTTHSVASENRETISGTEASSQTTPSSHAESNKNLKNQNPTPPTNITINQGFWGPIKIQLPNNQEKRVALLNQIKSFQPTKPEPPKEKLKTPTDHITRIIEELGFNENIKALKEKQETKQAQQKEKKDIQSKGITLESRQQSENAALGRGPKSPKGK